MGEVYKARDTRLERQVAVKVLLSEKLADADLKRRFVQEARAASALNHPNIVTIYDIGNEGGVDYIVMELVTGKSLDRLIPRGGMRIDEILRLSVQIADALATAHSAGIVHRDLKPGNVMATTGGVVKILDFGLAKLSQGAETPSFRSWDNDATAETATAAATAEGTTQGMILGTVSYMSPEQAEGKPVDARSDIFAFGALLFEMVAGRKAFAGDSPMATITAILRDDPMVPGALPSDFPAELERIMARCLRKDPARRFQYMADAKVELEELKEDSGLGKLAVKAPTPAIHARLRSTPLLWLVTATTVAVLAFVGWRESKSPPETATDLRPVPLTSDPGTEDNPSFSPDGQQVAFTWDGEKQDNLDIYVKLIGTGVPLRLTTDPAPDMRPKWSPDGRTIAFIRVLGADAFGVMWIPALGGAERRLAQFYSRSNNGNLLASLCWTPDSKGLIVSGSVQPNEPNRLLWVQLETGEARPITNPPSQTSGDSAPALSSDGRTLGFLRAQGAVSLQLQPVSERYEPRGETRKLPTGVLLPRGPAWMNDGRAIVFASPGGEDSALYRIAISGSEEAKRLAWAGTGASNPALAPHGNRLAFSHSFRDANIWKLHLDRRPSSPERFIASSFREAYAQYSPDGKRIAFFSNRGGTVQIWTCDADGSRPTQITAMSGSTTGSPRWSPDGQQVSFDSDTGGRWHIYAVSADGGKPRQITNDGSTNVVSSWSHDGRWIYFGSNRSGTFEVWKAPAGGGDAVQMTHAGGSAPVESPDGKSLYFTKRDGAEGVWRMPVEGGQETQILDRVYRYNFAVAEREIYFTPPPSPDGTSSIEVLNLVTRGITRVAKIDKPVDLGLALSPDGRDLAWAQLDYVGGDLMLVENFR
jgi:Tol biopolymer transport system component